MAESLNVVAVQAHPSPDGERRTRNGRWTLAQLRQTDGIVPLQSGTNKFDSQKGKTAFGAPRNTQVAVNFSDDGKHFKVEGQQQNDTLIRLQSGTNKFESQKKMTSFGSPRDVKGKHLKRIWELEFPEECLDTQDSHQHQNNQTMNGSQNSPSQSSPVQQQQHQPNHHQQSQSHQSQQQDQFRQQPVQYQQKQYSNIQRH
uniref:Uncharacterized protein n=1 Tax=Panagrolaimus sp. PS1159 TaxID=55785 RepID=A0AC35FJQ3_9BILA